MFRTVQPTPIKYTAAQRDQVLKYKLLTDFLFFTRYFFKQMNGKKFIVAPHHITIAKKLEDVAAGKILRLILNVAPRHGKSAMVVQYFTAWCLANEASAKFLHVSYATELAWENSSIVRNIVKCEEYQRLFPVRLKSDSDSKQKWWTEQGGGMYSTSSQSAVTGFGCGSASERVKSGTTSPADGFMGCLLVDDGNKSGDLSKVMLDAVNNNYVNTLASRMNSPATPVVVIQQRIHLEDLTGFLMGGGSGEAWELVKMPALDENDCALWPDVMDAERLIRMRKANPLVFEGQYQQEPYVQGGNIFREEWWQHMEKPPQVLYRNIYADTAMKTKEENDFSVFQCWGKTPHGIIMLDQVRGKWEAPELLIRAKAFWAKQQSVEGLGTLRAMKIEDKASGTGLIQQLKDIPVVAVQRDKDKVSRANDVVPWVASGNVALLDGVPHMSDFLSETASFPNGSNDDTVDPMMDAIDDMLQGSAMTFIDSDIIRAAVAVGSGQYLGNDALVCGVYVAKDSSEQSYIQFRRGKDAMSEAVYTIDWEKSSDPQKVVSLVASRLDAHKPDIIFICDSGFSGTITDRLVYLGYNITSINMQLPSDMPLKYSDKCAEMYRTMKTWVMEGGSIAQAPKLEQELCGVTYHYDGKDRLVIDAPSPWASALALTFALPVPERQIGREKLDMALGARQKEADYDPLDGM